MHQFIFLTLLFYIIYLIGRLLCFESFGPVWLVLVLVTVNILLIVKNNEAIKSIVSVFSFLFYPFLFKTILIAEYGIWLFLMDGH